jgi:glycosyltransferase involved in cell wall biosynthesis
MQVFNFDKIICLSDFHKNYVMAKQKVPIEKIWVSRNGITPEKFKFERKAKNPNKVVYMSSPDRGLDRCILIMDELRKEKTDLELHVYYGLENLYKYGLASLAEKLKEMFSVRPWIKYHGFTEQSKMYYEVSDAVLLLHPANFIETFMITALEMLALGVFPLTRRLGALANTLAHAESKGQATMLEHGANTESEIMEYASVAKTILDNHLWANVDLDLEKHDWKQIAKEWVEEMKL